MTHGDVLIAEEGHRPGDDVVEHLEAV